MDRMAVKSCPSFYCGQTKYKPYIGIKKKENSNPHFTVHQTRTFLYLQDEKRNLFRIHSDATTNLSQGEDLGERAVTAPCSHTLFRAADGTGGRLHAID
jgi:hypothetical protein